MVRLTAHCSSPNTPSIGCGVLLTTKADFVANDPDPEYNGGSNLEVFFSAAEDALTTRIEMRWTTQTSNTI